MLGAHLMGMPRTPSRDMVARTATGALGLMGPAWSTRKTHLGRHGSRVSASVVAPGPRVMETGRSACRSAGRSVRERTDSDSRIIPAIRAVVLASPTCRAAIFACPACTTEPATISSPGPWSRARSCR